MAKNDRILIDGIIDDRVAIKLPSDKRDEAFEYLAFEQILKDFDLSRDEILTGSIDGRRDGGIDGFYILVNGHLLQDPESFVWPRIGSDLKVLLISCKHHDTFKQATLDNLAASLTEILDFSIDDSNLKGAYSESLLRFRDNLKYAYRKLSPRLSSFMINTYYVSRGDTSEIGSEVRSRATQIKSIVQESFGSCISEFTFFGSTELIELHRKIPNYTLELPFLEALTKGERYILIAKLVDYYKFVSDGNNLRRYLFDSNVRDFMGLNRVNEDIKTTLENTSSPDFWWLNNGVTILATSATVVGKSIKIEDIQIVNGLQTTESIYRYFNSGGVDPENRCILVKVIVSKDEAVRDSIIRATNNQTDVEFASLHATDKIQRDIEDVLFRSGLYYERRKNFYYNQGHTPAEIVSPLYIASGYVSLILKLPNRAVTLRSRFMRSPESYNTVFSDQAPIEVWPKIAQILKQADLALENQRPKEKGTDKFLKNWRHIISFLAVSKGMGKYDFSAIELSKFDVSKVNTIELERIWNLVNNYLQSENLTGGWTSRTNTIAICKLFARDYSLSGLKAIERRLYMSPNSLVPRRSKDLPLTEDFILKVKAVLPPQPWKPGLHKDISSILNCSTSEYFAAVDSLIEDGAFYQQVDGVLYDKDGNVVAFDPERVDPITLKLIDTKV